MNERSNSVNQYEVTFEDLVTYQTKKETVEAMSESHAKDVWEEKLNERFPNSSKHFRIKNCKQKEL